MSRRPGLVRRLAWSLVAIVAVFCGLAGLAGGLTIHRELNEAMDRTLEQMARRLLPLVVDDLYAREPSTGARSLALSVTEEEDETMVFQARDAQGRVVLRSHEAPVEPLTAALTPGFATEDGWRVYTQAAISNSLFVQIAERDAHRDEETLEAALGLLLPMAVLIPLAAFCAWLAIRRFAAPIEALRGEIARRHGDDLAPIAAHEFPEELSVIAASVNALMQRLRMAIEAEKEFAANAAHELRTPLAGALAQVQRLIAEVDEGSVRHRARQIKVALIRLSLLAEKLLQLARADAGLGSGSGHADLGQTVGLIVEDMRRAAGGQRVTRSGPERGPMVCFDQEALGIVVRNLVENALRHGDPKRPVTVAVEPAGVLRVANAAGPMSAETVTALKQRFRRGENSAAGTGLGLAIVERLAAQAGAAFDLASFERDGGSVFEATLRFDPAD